MTELTTDEHFTQLYTDAEVLLAAKAAHCAVQAINEAFGLYKLPQWMLCNDWYKASFTRNVEAYLYHAYPVRKVHAHWVRRMESQGWVVGETRCREQKTHPMLVSFNDLPIEEKLKLKQMRAVVMAFRKTN